MKSTLQLLLAIFISCASEAETLWVAQSSAGANDGSSAENAKAISWLSTQSSWGTGDGIVGPGDTVMLSGAISNAVVVGTNGTAGQPITISFASGAQLTATNWPATGAVNVGSFNFVTIDGAGVGVIRNTQNGTDLAYQADSTGIYATLANNVTVRRLIVTNLYERTPGSTNDGNRYGIAVLMDQVSDLLVESNRLWGGDTMVSATWQSGAFSNWTIHANTIGGCNHGITLGCSTAGAYLTNVVLSANRINDFSVWNGHASLHLDGIIIFVESPSPGYDGRLDGLRVFGNHIGPDVGTINTAGLFINVFKLGQVVAPWIYNNIFEQEVDESWSNGHIYMGPAIGGVTNGLVANNTFTADYPDGFCLNGASDCVFINNLSLSVGTGVSFGGSSSIPAAFASNTNIFANVYQSSGAFYGPSYAGYTFAGWQGLGFDSGSVTNVPSVIGYRPEAGDTIAIGKGIDLSAYFTTDFTGATRVAPWDIGAYEYLGRQATAGTVNVGTLNIAP